MHLSFETGMEIASLKLNDFVKIYHVVSSINNDFCTKEFEYQFCFDFIEF